jgi:zinc D-Ala-D-Ala carboxypeptidase
MPASIAEFPERVRYHRAGLGDAEPVTTPTLPRTRRGAIVAVLGLTLLVAVGAGSVTVLTDVAGHRTPTARPSPTTQPSPGVTAGGGAGAGSAAGDSGPPTPPAATAAPGPRRAGTLPVVSRIDADDQYTLAAAASASAFRGRATASVVYLVPAGVPILGWASTPAAARQGGSVLLTRPDAIPTATARELARLRPRQVVVVGSPEQVADAVLVEARRVVPEVTRVSGTPAALTMALDREAFPAPGPGERRGAWVADPRDADGSAVAATVAAARREPLLFLDGPGTDLAPGGRRFLRDLGVVSVTVVGGTGAVAPTVVAELTGLVGPGNVARVDGDDVVTLAAGANRLAWRQRSTAALLVNPNRPGAWLAGAVLGGRFAQPVLPSAAHCLRPATRSAVLAPRVRRVVLIGGERSLRSLAERLMPCRSTTDPASAWVLANKQNPLRSRTFEPSRLLAPRIRHANGARLHPAAASALATMLSAATRAGAGSMAIDSGYRSYATQGALYRRRVAERGRAWTERWYARPGHSEHQTGFAVDLAPVGAPNCSINDCIDTTPQGIWLARNSWRFGFVLRYPQGKTPITGMGYEPWHFRYVGPELAAAYHAGGWTSLEEFLGAPPAPSY